MSLRAVALACAVIASACSVAVGDRPAGASGAPAAAVSSPASPSAKAGAADWPTYHRDNSRTGASTEIAAFTGVEAAWQTDVLSGDVYAEPIIAAGRVIVATERNVVYAFDARSGEQRWKTELGAPVDAATLPCGNIKPTSGITGTPVADVAASLVYVVAFEQPFHHELYALDLASGAVRFHRTVDRPGGDPRVHQQRGALTLANGYVYVPYGGLLGDCGPYRGAIVAAPAASPDAPLRSYVVPANREAGIWATSGLAVDEGGRLYAATGNSDTGGAFDMNDAVLRFSPDLTLEDHWAPADWLALSRADIDIGSIGPVLLPGGLVVEAGKNGYAYLLRASDLGKIGGEMAKLKVCGGAYGGFAYANGVAFVPCNDGLAAVQVQGTTLRSLWRGPRAAQGSPIVAAGVVWVVDYNGGTLYALDLENGSIRSQVTLGHMQHFTTPSASGDLIYVAAGGRLVALRVR